MSPAKPASSRAAGLLLIALAVAAFVAIGFWSPASRDRAAGTLRERHDALRARLGTADLAFVRDVLLAHFAADERLLYAEADRRAGGKPPCTAALRHVHVLLRDAVHAGELRRALALADLLLELEEEIVFPLFERSPKSADVLRRRESLP
jgi:hypothetical protein